MSNDEVRGQQYLIERRAALLKVFRALSSRWPKFFGPARADELLPVWVRSTAGIDVEMLERAAVDFAANSSGQYAPSPHAFSDYARAFVRRVSGTDRDTPTVTTSDDIFTGARPFWYVKAGEPEGWSRLDEGHAIAWAPRSGGSLSISEHEMDQLYSGQLAWGWLRPDEVPVKALPPSWRAEHKTNVRSA